MTEATKFRWYGSETDLPSPDLLRLCGQKLTDKVLWQRFQDRFQKRIFTYLLRSLRDRQGKEDAADVVGDLAQDVYIRLVQENGRMLRSFKGDTEFSVLAFLARICMSVVTDHYRYQNREKRQASQVIPIEQARTENLLDPEADLDMSSVLSWIDVERLVESESDRANAARNVLIFKLHYIDGFSQAEIAQFPGFNLVESGVEAVLGRLRTRLRKRIENNDADV